MKQRRKPTPADAYAFTSMCIRVTADLAKTLQAEGLCDPALYESLKAMQMTLDRAQRKAIKAGETRDPRWQKILQHIPE